MRRRELLEALVHGVLRHRGSRVLSAAGGRHACRAADCPGAVRPSSRRPAGGASPRWSARSPAAAGEGEVVGVGRRPRAGDDPGRLPARAVPDAGPARACWPGGRPTPGASCPSTGLRVSRSLRKSCARFEIRVDTAFDEVIEACADRRRPGRVDQPGHQDGPTGASTSSGGSTASRRGGDGRLAGGLYGVAIGGLFAGESMFHRADRRVQGGPGRRWSICCVGAGGAAACSTCSGRPPTWRRWARSRSAGSATTSCWPAPWPGRSPPAFGG